MINTDTLINWIIGIVAGLIALSVFILNKIGAIR